MDNLCTNQKLCLSPGETAEMLGVSRNHIYKFIESGEIRSFKLGQRRLINREALDDFRKALEQKHTTEMQGFAGQWEV